MGLLHLLAYAGGLAAFLFVTLSLEEHSKHAKVVGMRSIYAIVALHVVLYFTDSLPFLPTVFSILCHLAYLSNFSTSWPYISLTSPRFILSCVLVVADHFIWFFHFAAIAQEAKKYRGPKYRYGGQNVRTAAAGDVPAFGDVAAFFAICVWFVPLYLFLSLSANDNALPSYDNSAPPSPSDPHVNLASPGPSQRSRPRASTSLVKSALTPLLSLLPRLRGRARRNSEGLIAPRTPVRGGTPLHSPSGSYFPWGQEDPGTPGGGMGNGSLGLTPDRMRTPPPPRRVQSEMQVTTKGALNPRAPGTGAATGRSSGEEARRGSQAGRQGASSSLAPVIGGGGEGELLKRKGD
ncbi:hypothetical protein IAT38_004980 [Cryptococcus sp. DSM 104549]